ncbi:spore germination protein GerPE [Jeotgalibacillus soli]|uniref:Spore germination protein GerPE n=1 Tax=Jeotgalibacillus soli TaxID=889306 RepID=A0A0C2VNR2_9BACL|nr:spore germination protein GerPE [Jeotgalibacillus soli]KIL45643.1 hypothetical protein KP78_19920 [Jeotgalibacillus soli]
MTSTVNHVLINTLSFSSVIQIGDSALIDSHSNIIAVHREVEVFFGQEAPFEHYSIFYRPSAAGRLTMINHLLHPTENHAETINIVGISASSVLHVGDSSHVRMVSRTKHIRQFYHTPDGFKK